MKHQRNLLTSFRSSSPVSLSSCPFFSLSFQSLPELCWCHSSGPACPTQAQDNTFPTYTAFVSDTLLINHTQSALFYIIMTRSHSTFNFWSFFSLSSSVKVLLPLSFSLSLDFRYQGVASVPGAGPRDTNRPIARSCFSWSSRKRWGQAISLTMVCVFQKSSVWETWMWN